MKKSHQIIFQFLFSLFAIFSTTVIVAQETDFSSLEYNVIGKGEVSIGEDQLIFKPSYTEQTSGSMESGLAVNLPESSDLFHLSFEDLTFLKGQDPKIQMQIQTEANQSQGMYFVKRRDESFIGLMAYNGVQDISIYDGQQLVFDQHYKSSTKLVTEEDPVIQSMTLYAEEDSIFASIEFMKTIPIYVEGVSEPIKGNFIEFAIPNPKGIDLFNTGTITFKNLELAIMNEIITTYILPTPIVEKVSKSIGNHGDTINVYGKKLKYLKLVTFNNIPTRYTFPISNKDDHLQIIVPDTYLEGSVLLESLNGEKVKILDNFILQPDSYIPKKLTQKVRVDANKNMYVILEWEKHPCASVYEVRYRLEGESWRYKTVENNSLKFNQLNPSADYEWQVKSKCEDNTNSPFSTSQRFNTGRSNSLKISSTLMNDINTWISREGAAAQIPLAQYLEKKNGYEVDEINTLNHFYTQPNRVNRSEGEVTVLDSSCYCLTLTTDLVESIHTNYDYKQDKHGKRVHKDKGKRSFYDKWEQSWGAAYRNQTRLKSKGLNAGYELDANNAGTTGYRFAKIDVLYLCTDLNTQLPSTDCCSQQIEYFAEYKSSLRTWVDISSAGNKDAKAVATDNILFVEYDDNGQMKVIDAKQAAANSYYKVESNPEFWRGLVSLVGETVKGLVTFGVIPGVEIDSNGVSLPSAIETIDSVANAANNLIGEPLFNRTGQEEVNTYSNIDSHTNGKATLHANVKKSFLLTGSSNTQVIVSGGGWKWAEADIFSGFGLQVIVPPTSQNCCRDGSTMWLFNTFRRDNPDNYKEKYEAGLALYQDDYNAQNTGTFWRHLSGDILNRDTQSPSGSKPNVLDNAGYATLKNDDCDCSSLTFEPEMANNMVVCDGEPIIVNTNLFSPSKFLYTIDIISGPLSYQKVFYSTLLDEIDINQMFDLPCGNTYHTWITLHCSAQDREIYLGEFEILCPPVVNGWGALNCDKTYSYKADANLCQNCDFEWFDNTGNIVTTTLAGYLPFGPFIHSSGDLYLHVTDLTTGCSYKEKAIINAACHTGPTPGDIAGAGRVTTGSQSGTNVEITNYPNPFKALTTIRFNLPKAETVNLNLYNSTGRLIQQLIANEEREKGTHYVKLSGESLTPGIYFYKMNTPSTVITKKIIVAQ